MLKNVDIEKFIKAMEIDDEIDGIQRGYDFNYEVAEMLINQIDESLEYAVLAWIEGRELPNISYGKYSIGDIMANRGGRGDIMNRQWYLNALHVISIYMTDPDMGERLINWPIM